MTSGKENEWLIDMSFLCFRLFMKSLFWQWSPFFIWCHFVTVFHHIKFTREQYQETSFLTNEIIFEKC